MRRIKAYVVNAKRYPLAALLGKRRVELQKSTTDIARAIGLTNRHVIDVENGKNPSDDALRKWAAVLEITESDALRLASRQRVAAMREKLAEAEVGERRMRRSA